jgi:hypothetical protein
MGKLQKGSIIMALKFNRRWRQLAKDIKPKKEKIKMNEKEKHIRKCYKLMREAKGSILYPKGKQ